MRTLTPAPGHRIYPYLLRGVSICRPNQVWAMDISYIPMRRGIVYLAAVAIAILAHVFLPLPWIGAPLSERRGFKSHELPILTATAGWLGSLL